MPAQRVEELVLLTCFLLLFGLVRFLLVRMDFDILTDNRSQRLL